MENNNTGTLYLVATPIGNLDDITLRAIQTLKEADLIAAEDTRHTLKLLNHYGIKKPLISYFEHNKRQRGDELINTLLQGKNIALVTDAGTPGISDPGEDIVRLAVENQIPVTMIPGATASVMGLVLSGLKCSRFCFEGFLAHGKKERTEQLKRVAGEERTIIFYVSPHRVIEVLKDCLNVLGNRRSALCRELTKKHEEVLRGSLDEIINNLSLRESIKGEMLLIVEGCEKCPNSSESDWESVSLAEHIEHYLREGYEQKEAMKKVASDRGISKREVYSEYVIKKGTESSKNAEKAERDR